MDKKILKTKFLIFKTKIFKKKFKKSKCQKFQPNPKFNKLKKIEVRKKSKYLNKASKKFYFPKKIRTKIIQILKKPNFRNS